MNEPKSPASPGLGALSLRHARFGFYALLGFLSLGVLLEAFHGFKAGFYLDADNEARRLSFRLAHAHGTLLSLLHIVFGLVLGSRLAPSAATAARAGAMLTGATLLLPGGFVLGGFFIHGGDPGFGILLVPFGAVLLFGAIGLMARGLGHQATPPDSAESGSNGTGAPARHGEVLREIAFGSPEYDASFALRLKVLREPLGLTPGPEERAEEARLIHLGAFDGSRLVGCLMLHDLGAGRVRMRQVAVDFERQRAGLGRKLVRFSEDIARQRGFRTMVLHARETAVPFYDRLGYARRGEPFLEVTLPHLEMDKELGRDG